MVEVGKTELKVGAALLGLSAAFALGMKVKDGRVSADAAVDAGVKDDDE